MRLRARSCPVWLPVVVAILLAAGCASSHVDRAETSTTGGGSTSTASSFSTVPGTASTSTAPKDSGAGGSACDLVGPDDLTHAGVTGKVQAGDDVSENFTVGANITSTACEFLVDQGTIRANVIVVVAEHVDANGFAEATDSSFDEPEKLDGLGDRAALLTEEGIGGRPKLTLWAIKDDRLVKILGARADVTPPAVLEALASSTLAG